MALQDTDSYLGSEEDPVMMPTSDERMMAVLSHILCLVAWLLPPLIIYILKKDESAFVAHHARESLNFQITIAIVGIVLAITILGLLVLGVLGIIAMILIIVATIKANDNKLYRYPFSIRLIK